VKDLPWELSQLRSYREWRNRRRIQRRLLGSGGLRAWIGRPCPYCRVPMSDFKHLAQARATAASRLRHKLSAMIMLATDVSDFSKESIREATMHRRLMMLAALALACIAVPKAEAESLVTISCDKPKGFNIAYGTTLKERFEARQKNQAEPPPTLRGPTEDGVGPQRSSSIQTKRR
jgi:hypothetical protein